MSSQSSIEPICADSQTSVDTNRESEEGELVSSPSAFREATQILSPVPGPGSSQGHLPPEISESQDASVEAKLEEALKIIESLKKEKSTWTERMGQLKKFAVEKVTSEILNRKKVQQEHKELAASFEDLKRMNAELGGKIQSLKSELSNIANEKSKTDEELLNYKTSVKYLQKELDEKTADSTNLIESLKIEVSENKKLIHNIATEKETLVKEYDSLTNSSERRIFALEKEVNGLKNELNLFKDKEYKHPEGGAPNESKSEDLLKKALLEQEDNFQKILRDQELKHLREIDIISQKYINEISKKEAEVQQLKKETENITNEYKNKENSNFNDINNDLSAKITEIGRLKHELIKIKSLLRKDNTQLGVDYMEKIKSFVPDLIKIARCNKDDDYVLQQVFLAMNFSEEDMKDIRNRLNPKEEDKKDAQEEESQSFKDLWVNFLLKDLPKDKK